MTMRAVGVPGHHIAYVDECTAGPTVVLLHGNPTSCASGAAGSPARPARSVSRS